MRKFDESSSIVRCFESPTSPLIKIDINRNISYYNTKNQKIGAIEKSSPDDKFIIAWAGHWKTDVFHVSKKDIKKVMSTFK